MAAAGFYPRTWSTMTAREKGAFIQFRDLRGTAVTLLSESGASIPQICAITGHSLQSAHRILEKYLARTSELSRAAIHHFETSTAAGFANRLQTTIRAPDGATAKGE